VKSKAPISSERASESIVLNLAEGSTKPSPVERRKFYRISLGSLREIQAIFDLQGFTELKNEADCLGSHLYKLSSFK
jgi:four helix bundle protein